MAWLGVCKRGAVRLALSLRSKGPKSQLKTDAQSGGLGVAGSSPVSPTIKLRSRSPLSELGFSAHEVQSEAAEAMSDLLRTGRSRRVSDECLGAGCYAAYVSSGSTEGQLPVHRVVRISRRVLKGICRSDWSDRSVFVRAIEPQANEVRQTASRENKIKGPIQAL